MGVEKTMIYQKVSISKQKWGNLRSAAVLVYAFPSPSEHFFFVFWHMKVSVEEHCCQQQREYQEINLWSKNTGFADIHPLPELNHHYVLPVLKQDMCVRVWERVCVCVNPGNAHYSINQRHRELFTGALFFGHLYRNKSWLKYLLLSSKDKNIYKKSHTCFI